MANVDWDAVKREYESGISQKKLSVKYNCSRAAIQNHIRKERWYQDPLEALRRATEAKVAGMPEECRPIADKAAAIEAEAQRRADVLTRHRLQWLRITNRFNDAIDDPSEQTGFEKMKRVKISTEALLNIQGGERRAWGLDQMLDPNKRGSGVTLLAPDVMRKPENAGQ